MGSYRAPPARNIDQTPRFFEEDRGISKPADLNTNRNQMKAGI